MGSWPQLLGPLMRHEPVPVELVQWGMREVMSAAATPSQIAAFAVAMRMHGETAEEIAALVEVMLEFSERLHYDGVALDTCGTGGDGAHTVNISTMAALLLSAAGVAIVKHGGRAASSKCGSADVLEELGLRINITPEQAQQSLDQLGAVFCFAPTFHPALRFAGPTRREIGVPTIFNILGPLANPAQPRAQIVGVPDAQRAALVAEALRLRGTSALVVRGDDGLDELSIFVPSTVWSTWLEAPVRLDPQQLGIPKYAADSLLGGDAAFNAYVARRVLAGETTGTLAAVADAVLLNAAAAMVAVRAAEGQAASDLPTAVAVHLATLRPLLASGAGGRKLDQWIAFTPR